MMKLNRLAGACTAAAAVLLAPCAASAQTQAPAQNPAKASAKPAPTGAAKPAGDKTLSFAAGSGKGPILSRDELRACIQQEESVRTRMTEHEARRGPLNAEKEAIAAEQAALRAERGPIDEVKKQADELAERFKAYTARVEAWNQRVADFNAKPGSGSQADKQRNELNKEREDLQKAQTELEADKARLTSAGEVAVRNYNAKAGTLDQRVADWNQRNQAWNDATRLLETERQGWVGNCSDRRYREDDEIAIRRGK